MDGILEKQVEWARLNDEAAKDLRKVLDGIVTVEINGGAPLRLLSSEHGLFVEQQMDMIHLPNAAAVDALIEALRVKREGME